MVEPYIQPLPFVDPHLIFQKYADLAGAIFLDSAMQDNGGRYSYIVFNPFQVLHIDDQAIYINGEVADDDPFTVLKNELAKYQQETIADLPPFQGGVVGCFGYDFGRFTEDQVNTNRPLQNWPIAWLGFYRFVVAFDVVAEKSWIVGHNLTATEEQIVHDIMKDWQTDQASELPALPSASWSALRASSDIQNAIANCVEAISRGDIFQANITTAFQGQFDSHVNAYDVYRVLRHYNPAPYAAYMNLPMGQILSLSPELFLQKNGSSVITKPIKGTVAVSESVESLCQSEKDLAENTMIVDLLRNDLSKVCQDHSVEVPELCQVYSFPKVHHLISTVTGLLREDIDAVDVLRATFPGGSITGAPKIKAMEVIHRLEEHPRGPYCGSIGYIGFDGDMLLNIVIRTMLMQDQQFIVQAGGGIVLDSDPALEEEELMTKANSLLKALS